MICISRRSLARIARSRSIVLAIPRARPNLLTLEASQTLELHVRSPATDLRQLTSASFRRGLPERFRSAISVMTASIWSSAISSLRGCDTASALRRSNSVRRRCTSRLKSMKVSISSSGSSPSAVRRRSREMTEAICSWVCRGCSAQPPAPARGSMTMRMPSRSTRRGGRKCPR